MKRIVKKIWENQFVKIMVPVYGEWRIITTPTCGHAYGYESGLMMMFFVFGKYGLITVIILAIRAIFE